MNWRNLISGRDEAERERVEEQLAANEAALVDKAVRLVRLEADVGIFLGVRISNDRIVKP